MCVGGQRLASIQYRVEAARNLLELHLIPRLQKLLMFKYSASHGENCYFWMAWHFILAISLLYLISILPGSTLKPPGISNLHLAT